MYFIPISTACQWPWTSHENFQHANILIIKTGMDPSFEIFGERSKFKLNRIVGMDI